MRHTISVEVLFLKRRWGRQSCLSSLMEKSHELSLPSSIKKCEVGSLTSVSLYSPELFSQMRGFGCLLPKSENFDALGVLFNHNIFPHRCGSGHSETWIFNDKKNQVSQETTDKEIVQLIKKDREKLFPGQVLADFDWQIHRWPRRIPIYNRALREFLGDLKNIDKGPLLVGNYLGDLGLSKILFHAQDNVEKVKGGYFG